MDLNFINTVFGIEIILYIYFTEAYNLHFSDTSSMHSWEMPTYDTAYNKTGWSSKSCHGW